MSGYGQALLLDHSAWARAGDGRLAGKPRQRFEQALLAGELWSCPPALLEMRYSARDGNDFAAVARELDALTYAPLSDETARSALAAQEALAKTRSISHRVKPVDLLIAAIAASSKIGVLHYDHDYDTIARYSDLAFTSVWVAPRGSMD